MKWEETVMSEEQITEKLSELGELATYKNGLKVIAEAQAEISFNAGRESILAPGTMSTNTELTKGEIAQNCFTTGYNQGVFDGRKEVAEWIQNYGGSLDGFRAEWQAKLKEWGI